MKIEVKKSKEEKTLKFTEMQHNVLYEIVNIVKLKGQTVIRVGADYVISLSDTFNSWNNLYDHSIRVKPLEVGDSITLTQDSLN